MPWQLQTSVLGGNRIAMQGELGRCSYCSPKDGANLQRLCLMLPAQAVCDSCCADVCMSCRGPVPELLLKQVAMVGSTLLVMALSARWVRPHLCV